MFSQAAFPLSVSNWTSTTGVAGGPHSYPFGEPGYYSFLCNSSDKYGNDSKANGDYKGILASIDFLQNNPPEPFVLFIPGKGSHPPYTAPKDYYNL